MSSSATHVRTRLTASQRDELIVRLAARNRRALIKSQLCFGRDHAHLSNSSSANRVPKLQAKAASSENVLLARSWLPALSRWQSIGFLRDKPRCANRYVNSRLRRCAQFCAHHHSLLSATACCGRAVSSPQRNTCSCGSHFIVLRVSY
jgi:hypothetical protein